MALADLGHAAAAQQLAELVAPAHQAAAGRRRWRGEVGGFTGGSGGVSLIGHDAPALPDLDAGAAARRTSTGSAVFWASDAVEVGAVGLVGSVVGGSEVGSVVGGSEVGSASR